MAATAAVKEKRARSATSTKLAKGSDIEWIYINKMDIYPPSQRLLRPAWIRDLLGDEEGNGFKLEAIGVPVLSYRDGVYWVVDGQHRIICLRTINLGDEQIQCEVFKNLTPEEEALLFLERNNTKHVTAMDEFRVAVFGGRDPEASISRLVDAAGLRVANSGSQQHVVQCVGTLKRAYDINKDATPGEALGRALRILAQGFDGEPEALKSAMVMGLTKVMDRYGSHLRDQAVIDRFAGMRQGTIPIYREMNSLNEKMGQSMEVCCAAAIVKTLNSGRSGIKLESWWA